MTSSTATATATATVIQEAGQSEETAYSTFEMPIIRSGGRVEGHISSGTLMNPLEACMQPEATHNYPVEAEIAVQENGSVRVHYIYTPQHEDGIATFSEREVRWMGYADGITAEDTWAADVENAMFCAQEEVPELHDTAVAHMYEVVAERLDVPNDAALRACINTSCTIAPWDIVRSYYEADFAEWFEQYED